MSLNKDQIKAINQLYEYREQIENYLAEIESVLRVNFPEHYSMSYQHWIPQIKTALRSDTKWLPRGQYSMDDIFRAIEDQIQENLSRQGVTKFIK